MRTIFILMIAAVISTATFAQTGDLTVHITNIKKAQGKIYLGLYQPTDKWADAKGMTIRKIIDVNTKPEVSVTIPNVKYGTYAISYYHDENNNGKMDYSMWIPTEPYGFSNNPTVRWSKPSFETCAFKLSQEEKVIKIKHQY